MEQIYKITKNLVYIIYASYFLVNAILSLFFNYFNSLIFILISLSLYLISIFLRNEFLTNFSLFVLSLNIFSLIIIFAGDIFWILLFISFFIFLNSLFSFLIKISKVLINYKMLYEEERKMIKSIIKKKTLLESLLVSLSFILSFSSLLLIHPLRLGNPIFSVSLYLMIILIIILFIAFQKKD
jgi:hypothetical protein